MNSRPPLLLTVLPFPRPRLFQHAHADRERKKKWHACNQDAHQIDKKNEKKKDNSWYDRAKDFLASDKKLFEKKKIHREQARSFKSLLTHTRSLTERE